MTASPKSRSTHLKLIRSHRIVEWLENDFKKRAVFVPEYNTGPNVVTYYNFAKVDKTEHKSFTAFIEALMEKEKQ